jgi:hypothetical protein
MIKMGRDWHGFEIINPLTRVSNMYKDCVMHLLQTNNSKKFMIGWYVQNNN